MNCIGGAPEEHVLESEKYITSEIFDPSGESSQRAVNSLHSHAILGASPEWEEWQPTV